ncbi:C6 zinc finger domain-containing protein [Colletotrichum tofieldiae]|uniref:C6 zinc finger domain-containing protein n=1 Tax=Colletotrichum tofieldiae TaxID=708197 RepID=A0A166WPH2_9PEZI|nr:C6 zinc finger domain-containing protein [Colletotrichum tofieldiae]
MSIAQLMGLNRLNKPARYKVFDSETKCDAQHLWFRIVFWDQYLSLKLDISQGFTDRSMVSDPILAKDTPMGRLGRIHCIVASRILECNWSKSSADSMNLTQTLDVQLQEAANSLTYKWWLIPDLRAILAKVEDVFRDTRRLLTQVYHYNLLNQLYLPVCVNASRKMLSRVIKLHNFNSISGNCRTIDFLALMAAMTLLLAHMDSRCSAGENLLAHQYHSDRAMIEKVHEKMEAVNDLTPIH